jgi:CDGSH-type Zn-finger protein
MAAARITVMNNGSLKVEGDFELVDSEGRPFGLGGRARIALCRCGQSENKPFCDSSHKRCGFTSQIVAFEMAPPAPKPAEPAPPAPPSSGPAA